MKLARIHLNQPLASQSQIVLDQENEHYISNVMRLRKGSQLRIFNEMHGEFLSEVETPSKTRGQSSTLFITRKLRDASDSDFAHLPCALFFAPIKKTRMKFLLEKATELGVEHLIPVNTQNTQHFIESAVFEAYNKLLIGSSEQCERLTIPTLHQPISIKDLLGSPDSKSIPPIIERLLRNCPMLVCAERRESNCEVGSGAKSAAALPLLVKVHDIVKKGKSHVSQQALASPYFGVMVGPEGGFTDQELDALAERQHTTLVSLGKNILRSESAAVYSLCSIAATVELLRYNNSNCCNVIPS